MIVKFILKLNGMNIYIFLNIYSKIKGAINKLAPKIRETENNTDSSF